MNDQRTHVDRRQGDRRSGDRRTRHTTRHPIFEICRSMLHLVLLIEMGEDKPPKLVTRSVRWRKDATELHSDLGIAELKAAFGLLVSEEKLAGTVARVALNGELCVTRVITGTSDYVRRQLAEQQDRSQLYLSLGPGRKAQASSIREMDARHQQALLTVTNQRTLNVLLEVAEAVGIQFGAIEPSLVALARAQGQLQDRADDPCLLIQVDERAAELGVCHQGHLLLEYHPAGRASAAILPEILSEHLTRLRRHVDRTQYGLGQKISEVYLCGAPGPVELARRKFEEQKELAVHVLNPNKLGTDWQRADTPLGTEFSAALGAALAIVASDRLAPGPNLMDHVLAEARQPIRPILLRSAVPLAAVLLLAITMGALNFFQRQTVADMQAKLDALAPVQSRATMLRLELAAANTKLQQLRNLESRLTKPNWANIIGRIGKSMPADVWLERFGILDSQSGRLTGASYNDAGVYDFISYLEQVPDLSRVALEGTVAGSSPAGPTTNFDVAFSLEGLAELKEGTDNND